MGVSRHAHLAIIKLSPPEGSTFIYIYFPPGDSRGPRPFFPVGLLFIRASSNRNIAKNACFFLLIHYNPPKTELFYQEYTPNIPSSLQAP